MKNKCYPEWSKLKEDGEYKKNGGFEDSDQNRVGEQKHRAITWKLPMIEMPMDEMNPKTMLAMLAFP